MFVPPAAQALRVSSMFWLGFVACSGKSESDAAVQQPPSMPPVTPTVDGAPPRPAVMQDARVPDNPPAGAMQDAAPLDARAPMPPPTADAMPPRAPNDASTAAPTARSACAKRPVAGAAGVRFHHVHFNTVEPEADLAFFEKYLGAKTIDFCTPESGGTPTRATQTDRGYFLYTKVATAPDPRLNTYLEHIGWIHADPNAELERLVGLGAPLFPVGRAQCEEAFAGEMACSNYWFYLQAPSGARVEVAKGPGPAKSGFGHVHMIMGVDYQFFETVAAGSFKNKAIDYVNHTDVSLEESILDDEMVVETRGKPIDHLGYSTINLDTEKARILAAGLTLAEDISFKPEYGFRSFFVKSEKGVWIEMVEDTALTPMP